MVFITVSMFLRDDNSCLEKLLSYEIWMIELKNVTHIGELCFKGLDPNGIAEIGYTKPASFGYPGRSCCIKMIAHVLNVKYDNL